MNIKKKLIHRELSNPVKCLSLKGHTGTSSSLIYLKIKNGAVKKKKFLSRKNFTGSNTNNSIH